MKQLLLFINLIFLTCQTSFGQAPANDLIENATLISSFSYTESLIELGNATTDAGGQQGCNVSANYPVVYYKFTATQHSIINIYILDAAGNTIPVDTSFAIAYSASSINETDPSQLSLVSNCQFNTGTSFQVSPGNHYYILIYRDNSSGQYTNLFMSSINLDVPATERQALIDFYNETNGPSLWTTNTNWGSSDLVSTWHGVTVTNINGVDRVTEINLPDNNIVASNGFPLSLTNLTELTRLNIWNTPIYSAPATLPIEIQNLTNLSYLDLRGWQLSGSIPSEIANLSNLTWLDLRNNYLSGSIPQEFVNMQNLQILVLSNNRLTGNIPDLSSIPNLNYFWYEYNNYQFGDLETNFANNQTITNHTYSPQNLIDEDYSVAVAIGNSTTLTANATGTQNNYQWYKDGVILNGETNATLNVTVNSSNDYGTYSYEVTNNIVTGLTLQSRNFIVDESPLNNSDYDALVAFYNSTNGDNWTINTNWLDVTKPLSTWHGITLTNDRVTRISLGNNNLTGVLPNEIEDFTELQYLWLGLNQITGNIPPQIGNLSNLIELDLSPNTFSGSIPTEIGNLTNLEVLWLNQNGLSGNIPNSFQNLTSLRELYLIGAVGTTSGFSSSAFYGDFPDLTALPLQVLSIERNYFTFADIADEIASYQANISNFVFSPQYTLDVPEEVSSPVGGNIVLTLTDVPNTTKTGRQMALNQYQWYKDNIAINGATANTHTITNAQPSDNGIYHCVITNPETPNMEILRAPITVNVGTLGIDDETVSENQIKIYPIPATNFINIKTNLAVNTVEIMDISGKLVKKISNPSAKISIENLALGTYFIRFNVAGETITKRIIKQ